MSRLKAKLICCDEGDWEVLMVNGEVFEESHSISRDDWIGLMKTFGIDVEVEHISDEDMEARTFEEENNG